MNEANFKIDSLPGLTFSGYTEGEEWNGWACPDFDLSEAKKIAEAHEAKGIQAYYDEAGDKFVFDFPDEPEEYAAVEIEGRKLYPVGNSVWIWEQVND